jgi:hypothetical protein
MTKEQEDRLRCINGALTVLRCERDGILEKEPDNQWGKMLDSAIGHIETMTKEWAFAIGHPVSISNETIAELAERMAPIIVEVIKRRGPENL